MLRRLAGLCLLVTLVASCKGEIELKYDKIAVGMTAADVETIMGAKGETAAAPLRQDLKPVVAGKEILKWQQGTSAVYVGLESGKVVGKYIFVPSL